MVDLALLQTTSYLIAAISFAVTCAYYILNLRNTRKTRELQSFMQVFDRFNNKDFWSELDEMMKREWGSIEVYRKTEYAIDEYENYEYVANALMKMREKRDPSFIKKYQARARS